MQTSKFCLRMAYGFFGLYSFGRNWMAAEETQSVNYHVNVSMFPRKLLSIQTPTM